MVVLNSTPIDDSRWQSRRIHLTGKPFTFEEVSIHFLSCAPPSDTKSKGTILLIHGFPQTSYQFRHVITPLSNAGYNVIAPDYRGAGHSSRPRFGYEKLQMATDLHDLLTKHLDIKEKVHVVGHDIGGMIAHSYASRFSASTASVAWGECPLPGTTVYQDFVQENAHGGLWHFIFHWQPDIPELLTSGKEKQYIQSFYHRLAYNSTAISDGDTEHYALMFEQPGAMRAGFDVYRAFHRDEVDNRSWIEENGKAKVPCLALSGEQSVLATIAEKQASDMYESTEVAMVSGSGHWCAEENPADFVKQVLKFVEKHSSA